MHEQLDFSSVVLEMEEEGRNRDISKLARMNVLRTAKVDQNPDILKISTSELYKADHIRCYAHFYPLPNY